MANWNYYLDSFKNSKCCDFIILMKCLLLMLITVYNIVLNNYIIKLYKFNIENIPLDSAID